jgi:hypothetical protein
MKNYTWKIGYHILAEKKMISKLLQIGNEKGRLEKRRMVKRDED